MCIISLPQSATDIEFCKDFIIVELEHAYNIYKELGIFYLSFPVFCIGTHKREPCTVYSWIYDGIQYNFKLFEYIDGTYICKCIDASQITAVA